MSKKDIKRGSIKPWRAPGRVIPTVRFITLLFFLLFASCALAVLFTNLSNSDEILIRAIEEKIKAEVQKQKDLRVKLARVSSPERVVRIAVDELEMCEPTKVIFLRYAKKPDGTLVSESQEEKSPSSAKVTVVTSYVRSYVDMEPGHGGKDE